MLLSCEKSQGISQQFSVVQKYEISCVSAGMPSCVYESKYKNFLKNGMKNNKH